MIRIVIALCVVVMAAGGGFWAGRSNNAAKVAWLQNEVERYAENFQKQSIMQSARTREISKLSDEIAAYQLELANGDAVVCVADPVYDGRLRSILETSK